MPDLIDALQRAAERDLNDSFAFTVATPTDRGDLAGRPLGSYRFRVEARLDGRLFYRFPLGVAPGDVAVREPDHVAGQIDTGS